jgi:hypothetical protein
MVDDLADFLQGPNPISLLNEQGITLGGAAISANGTWTPKPPYALPTAGSTVSVLIPPASAALVRVH